MTVPSRTEQRAGSRKQQESALRRRSVPHAGRSNSPPRTPSTKAAHSIRVKRCISLARSFVSRTATRSCGAQATSTHAPLSLETNVEESMHLVRSPPAGTRLSRAGVVLGLKQSRHVRESPGAYRPGVVLQTHTPARSGRQDPGSTRRSVAHQGDPSPCRPLRRCGPRRCGPRLCQWPQRRPAGPGPGPPTG